MRRQGMVFTAVFLSLVVWAGLGSGWAMQWPDTGQTKCYDNEKEITCPAPGQPFYGQDAQYQGPARSYTKLDAQGHDLPETAASWTMVRDNVTGLIWEMKTDDGSIHDKDNIYSWCDTNPDTNGGDPGGCNGGSDTEYFIKALNNTAYGGFTDWRLPTVKELSTLIKGDWSTPDLDATFFPNTALYNYWSSTTAAFQPDQAFVVWFQGDNH